MFLPLVVDVLKALRFVSQNPIWRIILASICLLLKEKNG